MRNALDAAGLQHVQIVAADGKFIDIAADVLKDSELSKAVSILGLEDKNNSVCVSKHSMPVLLKYM